MNSVQANRLVKLAQFLQALKPSDWDYGVIRSGKGKVVVEEQVKVSCGTVACGLGWCPNVFPTRFKSVIEKDSLTVDDEGEINYDIYVEFVTDKGKQVDATVTSGDRAFYGRVDINDYAQSFFGMTDTEFDSIFLASDTWSTYGCSMPDVTKEAVAQKIYELVKSQGYDIVYA